ncbi:NAD-dependent epimerase/dehydratase family protein [Streptomyces sp. NPDC020141]|uniref:NAD-dependent epimerase/dehydratase family protein n=1 Tax=Streptomyces sp. NPDC020141 TaxID=3365065 RepID=UPI00378EB31E
MAADHWSGRTVLVTGVAGFIGSHFAEGLLARGARVIGLYRRDNRKVLAQLPATDRLRTVRLDLLDEAALNEVVAAEPDGVDAVVHCAALTGNAAFRRERPATVLDANMRTVSNVLGCARRHGTADVVLLGSGEVYLSATDRPTREEDDFRTFMKYAPDGYYLSKSYAEILAETYGEEYGMRVFRPRLTSIYGPRDNFEADTDRVVPRMFARAAAGEEIEIWGDGAQTRTYLYVTDLVDATLRMVEKDVHRIVNMGTPEAVSPIALARLVCGALGRPERYVLDREKSGGRPNRTFDLAKMREIADFRPRDLREGLRLTAAWYREHRMPPG